jgi:hypothetical protein
VPFTDSEELAKKSRAALIEVGTDHRLADPEPLRKMLEAWDDGEVVGCLRSRIFTTEGGTARRLCVEWRYGRPSKGHLGKAGRLVEE